MYKKKFLLCTIAGTFLFSHLNSTYADPPLHEIPAVDVKEGEETFNNAIILSRYIAAYVSGPQSVATITKSIILSEMNALNVEKGGRINAKEINTSSLIQGLSFSTGIMNIEDSVINVKGNYLGYGLVFSTAPKSFLEAGGKEFNKAILSNTKVLVRDGTGILGPYADADIELKNSEIRADVLLSNAFSKEITPTFLTLTTDNSILEGRVRGVQKNKTVFTLKNNSQWHLKISQKEIGRGISILDYKLLDINQRAQSNISILNLDNSSIIFNAPNAQTQYHYQTLTVGRGIQAEESEPQETQSSNEATVYNATGDAKIYFNTKWSDGEPKEQQKTDRLFVYGNVSGTTKIHFTSLSKDEDIEAAEHSIPMNMRGLSLIQVAGKVDESAFKLANGYVTMGGLPYKYTLNAYGPTSNRGKANITESFLQEDKNFWDFRLQKATLDSEGKINALVPQVASYLVMPSALFSAGFSDVNNHNTLLDNIRSKAGEMQNNKNKGIHFSSYGNKNTLSSNRDPLQYGYGADMHYAALQAGVTLAAIEDQDITTNLGLMGTYGKLAFTPKDMEGAAKSTLDKWSLAAYGSFQHKNGTHLNAFFSYGALKGNITTALIGNTTKVDNTKTLSASATIGQKLATDVEGLTFEPQAQLVYQRLMFGTLSDVDGFEVNMGNPHQWLVRIGGRLTQMVMSTEKNNTFAFYGKLNLLKAFGDNTTIQIGDTFHLNTMGSSLEGGVGINAHLLQNVALHADINYQHKLQKAGISGMRFSGGIQYRF
ncbi:autotransporter family protein [Bartonella harrusi]|uniref:Autotransporter outer membrane beta-barrel domain-containing protein n=1 Tax=Bartonella harrusi TaxID=2961895 RepID=A0ABY5EV67_9HYPH|nr:autotransporter outer membrane beta-barrel domain-containing protein [Bartonella harrusi]UTO28046.1 autotransporter outer membrane beta-barrel domain-containing protein [Bartonella harrusi]